MFFLMNADGKYLTRNGNSWFFCNGRGAAYCWQSADQAKSVNDALGFSCEVVF